MELCKAGWIKKKPESRADHGGEKFDYMFVSIQQTSVTDDLGGQTDTMQSTASVTLCIVSSGKKMQPTHFDIILILLCDIIY